MRIGTIVIGILMFAAATAILYAWGLAKAIDQKSDLQRRLMSACGSKVVKYLKKHDTITQAEIARQIQGTTAGQFWSRNKVKVQDGSKVSRQVIDFLLEQQYIQPAGKDAYRLRH